MKNRDLDEIPRLWTEIIRFWDLFRSIELVCEQPKTDAQSLQNGGPELPKSMPEGSFWWPGQGPRGLGGTLGAPWGSRGGFWEVFGGTKVIKKHVFLQTAFFYEKTCFFENRAGALVKAIILNVQGRFRRSSEPTKTTEIQKKNPQKGVTKSKVEKT